ncbi:MAG: glycerophosphodiester phosphodiesterase family protein [Gammaproteobacteria bacterium]|nr:glycerophosphodiester phosphodiesterase family protein [Gammaproteobacteria bacterium]
MTSFFGDPRRRNVVKVAAAGTALFVAGCAGTSVPGLATLDGAPPIVIAHRGASGYLPEETLEAYQKSIEMGASVIEFDVIATRDHVLIARHDPNLGVSTDVAQRPEYASRKQMVRVDGLEQEGWFASDFTLAEIKTLRATVSHAPALNDGSATPRVATIREIIELARRATRETGRTIWIYAETKNPSYHRALGLALEDPLLEMLAAVGWNTRNSPVFIQSFEPSSLRYMREHSPVRMVQLIDADRVDLKTGALVYNRPYDWTLAGDGRLFSSMVTPAGLAEIKTYADGIGPWKRYVFSARGELDAKGALLDVNGDGMINISDAETLAPSTLIADAHAAGLFVHSFTFRDRPDQLAANYDGDPTLEYLQFFAVGVDGVFSDYPDTALAAREEFLRKFRGERLEYTAQPILRRGE